MKAAHGVIDDANDKTATGTRRNVLAIRELLARYFEAVPARTRIVEDALFIIPSHVLDFDFVVISTHVRLRPMIKDFLSFL
jgi:hypothetical protein